jgi:uncharacterized membrane protein YbhN (UPF0104 family)
MATVHQLRTYDGARRDGSQPDGVLTGLGHLLKLEMELGIAEMRELVVSIAIAIGVAVVSAIALISSFAVLLAAAFAPLFSAPWQHLLIGGGGIFLLAAAGLAGSIWRLRSLRLPRETLNSFEENWRWLGAQVKSRLTLQ